MKYQNSHNRITFLVPHLNLSGGVKRIVTIADMLHDRGYETTIVSTAGRGTGGSVQFKSKVIEAPGLPEEALPDADELVLGFSDGPGSRIASFSPAKGRPYLLLLGFALHRPVQEIVTLRQGFHVLTTSRWLADIAARFGAPVSVIGYGFDHDRFCPDPEPDRTQPTVGMMYHPFVNKGAVDGLAAIVAVQNAMPQLHVRLFGTVPQPKLPPELRNVSYRQCPPVDELRRLYSSCDVFVFPSWREGLGMPGLEAMACGAALATTDTGGSRDYATHEQTALVSPPRNAEALAANIQRLLDDEALRLRLIKAGRELVKRLNWEQVIERIEQALATPVTGRETVTEYVDAPGRPVPLTSAEQEMLNTGWSLLAAQKYDDLLSAAEAIARERPELYHGCFLKGVALLNRGDGAKARAELTEAVNALTGGIDLTEQACAFFHACWRLDPGDKPALEALAKQPLDTVTIGRALQAEHIRIYADNTLPAALKIMEQVCTGEIKAQVERIRGVLEVYPGCGVAK